MPSLFCDIKKSPIKHTECPSCKAGVKLAAPPKLTRVWAKMEGATEFGFIYIPTSVYDKIKDLYKVAPLT